MAKFKDNAGREWFLSWDVYLAERVAERVGFDLDTCLDDQLKGLTDLVRASARLCRVVYVLCEGQADEAGVSPEQFGRSVGGDSLQGMRVALMESVADFYPAHQRTILRALITKGEEVAEKAVRLGLKQIETLDPFASATSSPASSASAPASAG